MHSLLTQINSNTEIRLSLAEAWGIVSALVVGIPSLIAVVRQYERTRIKFNSHESQLSQLTKLSEKQEQKIALLTTEVETLTRLVRDMIRGKTSKPRVTKSGNAQHP
ncbi:hypothetical protein ACO2Q8_07780 [Larkinella sp. VNQ87]|uniref:hypothetical protein n=1 Tax=Larkinella sp. VNQ87 TaxID=3400921 RepID=UPI003C0AF2D9